MEIHISKEIEEKCNRILFSLIDKSYYCSDVQSKEFTLYQYTSMQTLFNGIIAHDSIKNEVKARIRLSALNYLNDPLEAKLGHDMFMKLIDDDKRTYSQSADFKNILEQTKYRSFEASFTPHADMLTMWSRYGCNGKGVCVGLDAKYLYDESGYMKTKDRCFLAECIYFNKNDISIDKLKEKIKENAHGKPFNDMLKTLPFSQNFRMALLHSMLCCMLKNSDYKDEDEIRLILPPGNQKCDVKYRLNDKNIIIPYVDIELPIQIIKEVIIGPNQDSKSVCDSLQYYLDSLMEKYNIEHHICVHSSKLLYRQ